MARVINDFFPKSELEIEPFDQLSDISDGFQQTLARLLGYDESAGLFKLLRVDADGKLHVTSEVVSSPNGNVSRVNVGTVATLIIAANVDRREVTIYNPENQSLFIDFDNGVTVANGFEVPSGGSWTTDIYRGDVYGRFSAAPTATVSVMEFS